MLDVGSGRALAPLALLILVMTQPLNPSVTLDKSLLFLALFLQMSQDRMHSTVSSKGPLGPETFQQYLF